MHKMVIALIHIFFSIGHLSCSTYKVLETIKYFELDRLPKVFNGGCICLTTFIYSDEVDEVFSF